MDDRRGMDDRRALVIGASGGIGAALARQAAARGFAVTTLSRAQDGFEITDEASVAAHLGALEPGFDLVAVATGALGRPEKALAQLDPAALAAQFAVNTIGPALVVKHVARLLPRERAAHLGVLSARVGSIGDNGLGGWYSYRASKAALNQVLRTAAIELARRHPRLCVAALHPGTVDTLFTAGYPRDHKLAPDVAVARLLNVLLGLGPAQTGGFYDHRGAQVPW